MDRRSPAIRPTATSLPGAGVVAVRVVRRASPSVPTPHAFLHATPLGPVADPTTDPALRARGPVRTTIPLVTSTSRPRTASRPRRPVRRVAAVTVGGLGFLSLGGIAVAAGMGVTSSSLGAGSATIAACQVTGSITSTYVPPTASGSDVVDTGVGYGLTSVTLKGIHAGCATKTVYVTIVDSTATTKVLGSGSIGIGAIATGSTGTVQVLLTATTGAFLPVGGTGVSTAGANQVDVLIPN